jgi:hypothetical protein
MTLHQELVKCDREVWPKPERATGTGGGKSVRTSCARRAASAVGGEMFTMLRCGAGPHWPP